MVAVRIATIRAQTIINDGKDVVKQECLYTVGVNVN
jgi:hypothetical protein